MNPDPEHFEIHKRYTIQAKWTAAIRTQWFDRLALRPSQRVLEVGCGTGVIIAEIAADCACATFGLDIDPGATRFARANDPGTRYTIGDGMSLPFPPVTFDAAICHFLLLWLESPGRVLQEMKRVTRPGGWVLALAEPDYGGRIDYPDSLTELGKLQEQALQKQGCDTRIGRKLRRLFNERGFVDIRIGVLGADWDEGTISGLQDSEWQMLQRDLADSITSAEIHDFRQADQQAWNGGSRLLYVPTFFGGGRIPA